MYPVQSSCLAPSRARAVSLSRASCGRTAAESAPRSYRMCLRHVAATDHHRSRIWEEDLHMWRRRKRRKGSWTRGYEEAGAAAWQRSRRKGPECRGGGCGAAEAVSVGAAARSHAMLHDEPKQNPPAVVISERRLGAVRIVERRKVLVFGSDRGDCEGFLTCPRRRAKRYPSGLLMACVILMLCWLCGI